MTLIPKEDLIRLSDVHDGKRVSIYLPTHRAGNENEQDHIRLKNLLDEAERQLEAVGFSEGDIRELLGPIENQLVTQPTFWQHQLDGLCLFRASDLLYVYRLPFTFEAQVVVSDHFHIKPLLPMLSGNGQFYLLTLHQDRIDLYHGTRYGLSSVQMEDLPEEQSGLFVEQDRERPQQWHTDTRTPGGHPRATTRPAAFHGHGVIEQHDEDEILRYFRRIDEVLSSTLQQEHVPLLLAGGDDLIALYRRANTYPHTVEEDAIRVDPDALKRQSETTGKQLHERAWKIMQPRFEAVERKIASDYKMWAGKDSERASNDIASVVPSAYFERVRVLFVATDQNVWGTFDPETGSVHLEDEPTATNRDLLDFAAVHTLHNNGLVYAVASDRVPGNGNVAAVYRY